MLLAPDQREVDQSGDLFDWVRQKGLIGQIVRAINLAHRGFCLQRFTEVLTEALTSEGK